MGYWGYYPPYVTVAEKKAKAAKKLAQLRKKNPDIRPVIVEGRTIAKTWWGKSWNVNLERYADYANRIERGRSYVRNGMVLDLKIVPGRVDALVMGTQSKPYSVTVNIASIPNDIWKNMKQACKGKLDSLQELLTGKFPKALGEVFTEKGKGLFPSPKEIELFCSCPDWATMCKHVAAVLYGIGARLDEDPMLFFTLRNVNVDDLVAEAVADNTRQLLDKAGKKSKRTLDDANLSEMFGIEIDGGPSPEKGKKKPAPIRKQTVKKSDSGKPSPGKAAKKKPAPAPETPKTSKTSPVKKKKSVKKTEPIVKAPSARKQKTAVQPKQAMPATDLVESIIAGSRKGVSVSELADHTGFEKPKIYSIIKSLKQQRRIISPKWGIYKKNSAGKQ